MVWETTENLSSQDISNKEQTSVYYILALRWITTAANIDWIRFYIFFAVLVIANAIFMKIYHSGLKYGHSPGYRPYFGSVWVSSMGTSLSFHKRYLYRTNRYVDML